MHAEEVADYFFKHLADVEASGTDVSADRWDANPFGYSDPDEDREVRFSSEVIAEQIKGFSHRDQVAYLEAVTFCIDFHLAHPELTAPERSESLDRTLAAIALGSMQLMNTVQMAALDVQLSGS